PVMRVSRAVTCAPSANRRRQRWAPMKPAPPVTRHRLCDRSISALYPQAGAFRINDPTRGTQPMMTGATTSHDNDSATTVIVVTRNRRALLTETITRHPRPVIVVDDASTDETATAMQEQDVGLIRLRRSQGPSARTCGARQATTRYVAFADDD